MKRHAALTSTYINVLRPYGTLTAQNASGVHREPLRGVARGVLVAIGIALLFMPEAGSSEQVHIKEYISYRSYAYMLLDNKQEYKCLNTLYRHESNWNPAAVNGSHYGIPQGNSKYLASMDGYMQIQWGLTYINGRYGTPCKALHHWKVKGWH